MVPSALAQQEVGISWDQAQPIGEQVNPFLFSHRIAMYKELIIASNGHGYWGKENNHNPLWGLIYQLQWQKSSNRLGIDIAEDAIHPDAAWGYGNYSLSVIPYMAAIKANVVRDVEILAPENSIFDYIYGPNAENRMIPAYWLPAIEDWRAYFTMNADYSADDDEPLRIALWKAHKTSLDIVTERIRVLPATQYEETEMIFIRGWCRMVDFLSAAAWRTDHDAVIEAGLDVLPDRPLTDNDAQDQFTAFRDDIQHNIQSVMQTSHMSKNRFKFSLWLWQRMMRTRKTRDEAPEILNQLFDKNTSSREKRSLLKLLL